MALRLIAKTYWRGTQIRFRSPVAGVTGRPVALDTADGVRVKGLWWTADSNPEPRTAVIAAHPRGDFSEHHAFPALLAAGYGCLGANLRTLNNDADCEHERLLIDVGAYVAWLRERGVERVVLLGNSGGGSLFAFYQQQAVAPASARIAVTPGGRPSGLPEATLPSADAMVFLAAHTGQGLIMNEVIDPAVVDEARPLLSDASIDMYEPRNGFRPPPEWSRYAPEFVARYRAAQLERVRRLDALARELLADSDDAERTRVSPAFDALPAPARRRVLERASFEPLMVVYRTQANLHYADDSLDPSRRGYGSLLSPRPDLMNLQRHGFGRVVTPRGWLSTWSGLSSNANVLKSGPAVTVPTLVVQAGRDLDVYPVTHARAIVDAVAARDLTYVEVPDALHYFEEDESGASSLNDVMARTVGWLRERFAP